MGIMHEIRGMNRWIGWGASHRATLAVIVAVYFVVNVLTHDKVQAVALALIDRLTIRGANLAVAAVGTLVALVALPWLAVRIRRGALAGIKAFYVTATVLLVLASGSLLFAINSESIHFVQYGLLALLLFPLVGRVGETIVLVTLLGAVDEGFQYWVLHRNWGVYYDFNDVVLNLLGAAIGMMLLVVAAGPEDGSSLATDYSTSRMLRSGAFRTLGALGIVAAALLLSGLLAVDAASDASAWAVLRREGSPNPRSFWIKPEWGRSYHILSPVEGVLTTVLLMAFYLPLDFMARWAPRPAASHATGVPLVGIAPDRIGVAEGD